MDASCSRRSHRPTSSPGLGDLPESCVAAIISHLDPADICRLATLNRAFRAASCVDFVWEPKLPDNYGVLVEELLGGSSENLGKRDIFTGLCQPKSFHDGTKIVWLDKTTLRICLEISVKTLAITGIDDPRYWNYIPTSESRFRTVAYLQQTWWFQVGERSTSRSHQEPIASLSGFCWDDPPSGLAAEPAVTSTSTVGTKEQLSSSFAFHTVSQHQPVGSWPNKGSGRITMWGTLLSGELGPILRSNSP